MSVTFQSIRFGAVEIADDAVIEFPFGLIGLGGRRYTLLDRNPGTGFLWLHSVEDAALGTAGREPVPVLRRLLPFAVGGGRRAQRESRIRARRSST